jgi:hypothetical protein
MFVVFVSVCVIRLDSIFNQKKVPRRNFSDEAKEQAQGLLPIDLRLITNILNNLMKMCLFHLIMCEKKTREIDLSQSYVSNPSLVILVHITHLPLDLQSFIMTPSLSLRLCLLEQIEHSPMCPIPNLNIIVELAQGVITGMEATTRGEGRKQEKTKALN